MTRQRPMDTAVQEALRRSEVVAGSLEAFTAGLAPRLGAGWNRRVLPTPSGWSPADERFWDMEEGVLWRALHEGGDHLRARAVLTHAHGLQLYAVQRPHRAGQFLVGALLPAGVFEYGTAKRPQAVAVLGDPARAACAVRRRLLPQYRIAAMRVASGTRFKQAQHVVIGRTADGRPAADAVMPRAVRALLHEDGRWELDPGTGLCLPAVTSPLPSEVLIQEATDRLRGLGFNVTVTDGHPLDGHLRSPSRAVAAPSTLLPPAPPSSRGRTR
ncbi:hypothetical protein ACGFYY_41245 [Streptomyces sp. NPDC048331]|uniref:hypothetical protein n=1 Tax=Streptomyces sp. NPDC048331 TaxID=3365534 RepID=UPI0037203420